MKPLQNPAATEQLRRDFGAKGSFNLKLDEVVVPVRPVMAPWKENPAYRDAVRPITRLCDVSARGVGRFAAATMEAPPNHVVVVTHCHMLQSGNMVTELRYCTNAHRAVWSVHQTWFTRDMHTFDGDSEPKAPAILHEVSHTALLGWELARKYTTANTYVDWHFPGGFALFGEGAAEGKAGGGELAFWNTTANQGFNVEVYGLLYVARP